MDMEEGSPSSESLPAKRHKKHKKKHKRKREDEPGLVSPKTSIKLKLKLGSETMGTKNVMHMLQPEVPENSLEGEKTSKGKTNNGEEMSEEEKWLDALEKGTLNSYGEVGVAKKDPAQLTARQRALLHGGEQDALLQLPSGYKTVELTDEQKQRRQEKAKRRRQQANEKIENDKNQTVYKLLKKQESKNKRAMKARGGKRSNIPRILYTDSLGGINISLPAEVSFPLLAEVAKPYPEPELCGIEGCKNRKTSACSKSHMPVCGLQCYKKNLATWTISQAVEHSAPPLVETTT